MPDEICCTSLLNSDLRLPVVKHPETRADLEHVGHRGAAGRVIGEVEEDVVAQGRHACRATPRAAEPGRRSRAYSCRAS